MSEPAVPGARALYQLKIASLVWFVISTITWNLGGFGSSWFTTWLRVSALIWLGFALAETLVLVKFAAGRRATQAAAVAQAALILSALLLLVDVVELVPTLGGPELLPFRYATGAFGAIRTLASVTAEVCLWLALVYTLSSLRRFSPAYLAMIAFTTVIAILPSVLSGDSYHQLARSGVGAGLHWLRALLHLAQLVIMILALRELLQISPETPASSNQVPEAATATRDIVVGMVWLGGGLVVTVASYSVASSAGGGRYVVTTGAIAYGLVRLGRGLLKR